MLQWSLFIKCLAFRAFVPDKSLLLFYISIGFYGDLQFVVFLKIVFV